MDHGTSLFWAKFGELFADLAKSSLLYLVSLIVGRLVWYLIKVIMNCRYIHSAHGCSPKLAWSFCTEVLFAHHYRKVQRRQRPFTSKLVDRITIPRNVLGNGDEPSRRSLRNVISCSCIDDLRPSDSDEELPNSPACQASCQEMADIMDRSVQRAEDRLASTRRVRANIEALNR